MVIILSEVSFCDSFHDDTIQLQFFLCMTSFSVSYYGICALTRAILKLTTSVNDVLTTFVRCFTLFL